MTEKIKQVTQAIWLESTREGSSGDLNLRESYDTGLEVPVIHFLPHAIAAMAAMKGPTDAMVKAAGHVYLIHEEPDIRGEFDAMIDAALCVVKP